MTKQKIKRENWNGKYRNVIRDNKGRFVTYEKWKPKHIKKRIAIEKKPVFMPIRANFIYNFAVYLKENAKMGTSVKLELYVKDFVSDLSPRELEEKYKDNLSKQLISEVGVTGEHYNFRFIVLRQDETFKHKSKEFIYTANVLNISPRASPEYRYIRSIEGVLDVD